MLTVYHLTPAYNAEEILRSGLRASMPQSPVPGFEGISPSIYVLTRPEYAHYVAKDVYNATGETEFVLLSFQVKGRNSLSTDWEWAESDEFWNEGPFAFRLRRRKYIAPSEIRVVKRFSFVPKERYLSNEGLTLESEVGNFLEEIED